MRISTDVLQRTRGECKAFGFVQCALSNKAIDWERHIESNKAIDWERHIESHKSSVRCKVEHVFRIIKCQFGYRKTAYRGLMKNKNRLYAMFACANLYALAIAGRKLSTS